VLGYIQTVEPRLRAGASLEVDTSASIAQIVATILGHVLPESSAAPTLREPAP